MARAEAKGLPEELWLQERATSKPWCPSREGADMSTPFLAHPSLSFLSLIWCLPRSHIFPGTPPNSPSELLR